MLKKYLTWQNENTLKVTTVYQSAYGL